MADKSIFELNLQTTFATNDRLVVGNYANSDAEAITGQTLINLLATALDGHGGVASFVKIGSSGTNPVVDTWRMTYADESYTDITITNGLKGDTGDQTFVYFRWAHTEPSTWSDTTNQPDEWMGVYAGTATTPPTTVGAYTWVKVRGDKGDTGDASQVTSQSVTYMESSSGTVVPSGSWSPTVPQVTPGNFLWTKTEIVFNGDTSNPLRTYSVSRFGIDGTGSVSTVNGLSPDTNGNIAVTASYVPALDNTSVQAHLTQIESDVAGNTSDINDLNAAINSAVLQGAKQQINANTQNITSNWIQLTGLTDAHVVGNWGLFSDTDCTTPIAENAPPCDITIETGTNQWRYTLGTNSTAFWLRPTFILKQN